MKKINKVLLAIMVSSIVVTGCATVPPPQPVKIIQTNEVQTTPIAEQDVVISNNAGTIDSSSIQGVQRTSNNKSKGFLGKSSFDYIYGGDVSRVPQSLKDYDPTIRILPALGRTQNSQVNFNLDNTNISDLQNYIDKSTNGRVKLEYYKKSNALRLIYDSKVSVANDALKESKKWQDGGTPSPVLHKDGLVLFPYGQYEPKVTCQPLQLCDIQLQAGEIVKGLMIGDSVRWNEGDGALPVIYSGGDAAAIPHIVLKPTYAGLNTTLLATTDKRTYYIKLYSSDSANLSRVGFYYPADQMQQIEDTRKVAKAKDDEILTDGTMPAIDPRNMHFNYKVSGDTSAPFKPVQVFDDGTFVYIQMPDSIRTKDLPSFYVLGSDDEVLETVNFKYKAPFYVVHKMFDAGVLILGLDDDEQKITIRHK